MHSLTASKKHHLSYCSLDMNRIKFILMKEILFTVAKLSKDVINSLPTRNPKVLLPLWIRNNISFCMCKGIVYHWILYLRHKDQNINSRKMKRPVVFTYVCIHIYFRNYIRLQFYCYLIIQLPIIVIIM